MKYIKSILEFAAIRDIAISKSKIINKIINKEFENDTRLIFDVFIKNSNKHLILKWHDTHDHSIIKKIQDRTHFKSISEFNIFVQNAFNDLFENHFKEITETENIYGLYFTDRKFSMIIDFSNEKNPIGYDNIFNNKLPLVHVTTITLSTPNECKIIEINDENF